MTPAMLDYMEAIIGMVKPFQEFWGPSYRDRSQEVLAWIEQQRREMP